MFYKLIEYLSSDNLINKQIELSSLLKSEGNDNKEELLCDFDKIREKYRNDLTIFKIWYCIGISQILYNEEKIINIDKNIIDLSVNFYLVLLIQNDINVVDFTINSEYIQNLYNQIELNNEHKYYNFVLSEIILVLIDLSINDDNFNDDYEKANIEDINDKVNSNLEKNNVFKHQNIQDKNIEEIYIMIITDLILIKIENFNYIIDIINQIELEKIDITENMFNQICGIFEEKTDINNYLITEEKDFANIKKVNFYYIFLKYIFKKNIFIYNFDLFLQTRKFIIDKVKSGFSINSFIKENNKDLLKRGEYIIETLLDSGYYIQKLKNNNKINIKDIVVISESESQSIESPNIQRAQPPSSVFNNTFFQQNSNLRVSGNSNYTNQYLYYNNSVSNALIQKSENNNNIVIQYVKTINENYIDNKSDSNYILEFINGFICWGTGDYIEIYDKNYEKKNDIPIKGEILNNVITENSLNAISIIVCFNDKIKLYEINDEYKIRLKEIFIDPSWKSTDEISFILGMKQKEYLICYHDDFYITSDIFSRITKSRDKILYEKSVTSAIKIDENYMALKFCSFNDINSNKIKFVNTFQLYTLQMEIKGYSFLFSFYGLSVMRSPITPNENKVLLCACKKYYQGQKNGILLINTNNLEKQKNIYTHFYDTEDFEVYCFCPILIIIPGEMAKGEYKYSDTNYFLVGGFDIEKCEGCIKLFKVIYDEEMYQNKIEFIQDIDDFKGFKSPISCIIQEKLNVEKKFLVSCFDGNIYLFKGPNIDYYLKLDEEIKGDVFDFFKEKNL